MPSPFRHTMRSLETKSVRAALPRLVVAVVVLGGWTAWMTLAHVSVYARTTGARLEVSRMVHRVAAQEAGAVASIDVELGREVRAGDLLVRLDSTVEQGLLDEASTRIEVVTPKLEAMKKQLAAEQEVRTWQSRVSAAGIARAEVDVEESLLVAAHQEELRAITQRLNQEQLASTMDRLKATKEAQDQAIKARGAKVDLGKLRVSRKFDDIKELAHIAELERQVADLEAESRAAHAAAQTARAQIERREIRAPSAGKLGNISAIQVGDVLKAGDVIATVVPSDDIHAVAEFSPADVVGRIVPGQPARMRLAGFSWTQFGMLDATVEQVGSEPRDGTIRVELRIRPESARGIPVQHGLPGAVEVEVERVPPWQLLLRNVTTLVPGSQ